MGADEIHDLETTTPDGRRDPIHAHTHGEGFDVGERVYPLIGLNEALADAEAMRITKAVVDPWTT